MLPADHHGTLAGRLKPLKPTKSLLRSLLIYANFWLSCFETSFSIRGLRMPSPISFLRPVLFSVVMSGAVVVDHSKARAQAALPAGVSKEEAFGTVLRDSKWERSNIQVCWENSAKDDAPYRLIVRQAAEQTWQHYSNIKFEGWGKCAKDTPGIHIRIADEGAHTKALGKYLDQRPDGMVLNFAFKNWSKSCQTSREFCVYAVAAHEFGHALGFTHEQNRDDAPPECHKDAQGTDGDYKVTKYDPQSIMNYCNPIWNGDGKLSDLDREALQTFYGKPG